MSALCRTGDAGRIERAPGMMVLVLGSWWGTRRLVVVLRLVCDSERAGGSEEGEEE